MEKIQKYEALAGLSMSELNDSSIYKEMSFSERLGFLWSCKKHVLLGALILLLAAPFAFSDFASKINNLNLFDIFKSGPDKQAGEIVKQQLKNPNSFSLVNGDVLWQETGKNGKSSYVVSVAYDATNGFNATIRNCMIVAYRENDSGKIEWNKNYGIQQSIPEICNPSVPREVKIDYAKTIAKVNFAK